MASQFLAVFARIFQGTHFDFEGAIERSNVNSVRFLIGSTQSVTWQDDGVLHTDEMYLEMNTDDTLLAQDVAIAAFIIKNSADNFYKLYEGINEIPETEAAMQAFTLRRSPTGYVIDDINNFIRRVSEMMSRHSFDILRMHIQHLLSSDIREKQIVLIDKRSSGTTSRKNFNFFSVRKDNNNNLIVSVSVRFLGFTLTHNNSGSLYRLQDNSAGSSNASFDNQFNNFLLSSRILNRTQQQAGYRIVQGVVEGFQRFLIASGGINNNERGSNANDSNVTDNRNRT